ncbi:Probable Zinc-ribbon domain-containing protein [Orpheovirus IHUMI-LCC2]|uniref:Probable Zinc-ribbon domain-containing protein n=1 Tax=Orpheovirus IHUMI-LCC2 TaxID=2023057 RepID=A0A2I2L4S7_9VIRU|nr:Probable Zinc-ribbon domain-containing protein [Orpheovirus IHUMI-LCC2]SNW62510.1 Probable Zinc-ribbon domain-containing protein [Orpheovirus IHUMI-LCC2]
MGCLICKNSHPLGYEVPIVKKNYGVANFAIGRDTLLYKKLCVGCGKSFNTKYDWSTYCEESCRLSHSKKYNKTSNEENNKPCIGCGKIFYSKYHPNTFCTEQCKVNNRLKVFIKTCKKCDKKCEVSGVEINKTLCPRESCVDKSKLNDIHKTLSTKKYSSKAILWLNKIMGEKGINIKHAENGGEHKCKIGKYNFEFDGYHEDEETGIKTVYEFHGTYYHADPILLNDEMDKLSIDGKITNRQLYNRTLWRENQIKGAGYNLVTIWEREYHEKYPEYN